MMMQLCAKMDFMAANESWLQQRRRAKWPGTNVEIEMRQSSEGNVSIHFIGSRWPHLDQELDVSVDQALIKALGFPVVPMEEVFQYVGEMTSTSVQVGKCNYSAFARQRNLGGGEYIYEIVEVENEAERVYEITKEQYDEIVVEKRSGVSVDVIRSMFQHGHVVTEEIVGTQLGNEPPKRVSDAIGETCDEMRPPGLEHYRETRKRSAGLGFDGDDNT